MNECPYCGSKLNGSVRRNTTRSDPSSGHKTTSSELVSCPDCDEVIGGFSPH